MSATDDSRTIVLEFFEQAINGRNLDALDRFCSEAYIWHGAEDESEELPEVRGLLAFKRLVAEFMRAFPDFHTEIKDVVAAGDRVAVRYVEGGTLAAEFIGIQPTNTRVLWPGIGIFRVEREDRRRVVPERNRARNPRGGRHGQAGLSRSQRRRSPGYKSRAPEGGGAERMRSLPHICMMADHYYSRPRRLARTVLSGWISGCVRGPNEERGKSHDSKAQLGGDDGCRSGGPAGRLRLQQL